MIKDFIFKNKRVPLPGELIEGLVNLGNQIMANNESSRSDMNDVTSSLLYRQNKIINDLKFKNKNLIKDFNIFNAKAEGCIVELKNLERNINKDLLLFSKSDEFLYSIVEHFNDERNINKELSSNFTVVNGKLTLGYSSVASENILEGDISYSIKHRVGASYGEERFSNFSNVLVKDNNFYKTTAYSNIENDIVDFIIDIRFKEKREVNEFMIVVEAVEINSPMRLQCFYSKDNVVFDPIFESDSRVTQNENSLTINQADVTALKIVLTKTNADTKVNNRHGYIFAIDYMGFTKKNYRIDKESVVYLGPYSIVNEEGAPIYYSFATLKGGTCCIVDGSSSIDFYLSKDNINWYRASYEVIENDIVMFDSINDNIEDSSVFTKTDSLQSFFLNDNLGYALKANEKFLNYHIEDSNLDKFKKDTLIIKRNAKKSESFPIGNKYNGWKKNGNKIECFFFIKEQEGRYINFGNHTCTLNKKNVSGKVFLKKGKHHISTDHWGFINSPETIKNVSELKVRDDLYPYNHKYLIEGFSYRSDFNGDMIYKGVSEIYETELQLVNASRFFALKDEINVFTLIKKGDKTHILCRFENSWNFIEQEYFEVESKTNLDAESKTNLLYIKAILKSANPGITPKIDQIQVRVI